MLNIRKSINSSTLYTNAELYLYSTTLNYSVARLVCVHNKHLSQCIVHINVDNIERYKVANKTIKRAVSEARGRAYEDLYQRFDTRGGEKDIYKIAKIRERKTKDINQVKCIKDGTGRLLVRDNEIRIICREYFNDLFNEENESSTIELDESFDDTNIHFVQRIQELGVKEALKRMK